MCNLYDIGPAKHLRHDEWEEAVSTVLKILERPFGLRKTDPAPVVKLGPGGGAEGHLMRWGFQRPYNSAVNNSRVDKLDGPWSELWKKKKRCLFPVSTWYEWNGPTGSKQTFAFESHEGTWLWVAGIWESGPGGDACSMITRPATEELAWIHERMPALIDPADATEFLEKENPRELLVETKPSVKTFRCHNPLTRISQHRGPEPLEMLPGF